MKAEAAKLRRQLERYRSLIGSNVDRRTGKVVRELIAQAQARLREIGESAEREVTLTPPHDAGGEAA